jgi:hypothetical protein
VDDKRRRKRRRRPVLMPLSEVSRFGLGVVIVVLFLFSTWAVLLLTKVPRGAYVGIGAFLVVIGVFNILMFRINARRMFASLERLHYTFITRFWDRLGADGLRLLYLGMGVVFLSAGCALLIKSFVRP